MNANLPNLIAAIKTSTMRKVAHLDIKCNKSIKKIIFLLYKLSYINGFTFIGDTKVRIFFKYKNNHSVINNMFLISKINSKLFLKKKFVLKLFKQKFSGFIIFSSNKSYLTDLELLLFNVGGLPLFLIN